MMAIPQHLKNSGYRFIPLKGKQPFQPRWQDQNNYAHDDEKLKKHIKKGGNYGILCGGKNKLLVVDYDSEKAIETYLNALPETLTIRTGSNKIHAYYHTDTPESHQINDDNIKMDFQGEGRQVVGPGSTHPDTKKKYVIENDTEIAFIPYKKIQEILDKHTREPPETTHALTLREVARELGLPLKDGLQKCVWHNDKDPSLSVDMHKNQFKCHATSCQRQGGIRKLVMYEKGYDEENAQVWLNTFERRLYGTREGRVKEAIGEVVAHSAISNAYNVSELMEKGIPPITWRVHGLIPRRGLTMLGAAPGGRKTYIAQHLSLALSQGTPFLDKFETEQCTVLYIDEENGIHLLHRRYGQLSEGHDIGTFDNLFLLVYEGIKLDVEEGKATMRVLVEHYKADYVIIDSMVRFMQGDENNASDVRNVFDNLKELMEERDMGFMILHHLGKDPRKGMMGLRGSSDFSGMCDVVLIMYERNGELVLEMDKNRVVDTSDMKGMGVAVTHPTGVKDEAVRFTYTGESVQREEETLLDLAKEHIVRFLDKTDLEEFHVSAVLSHLSNKGVKKGTFYAGLRDFVADQVFHRKSRGVYTVDKNKFSTIKQKLVRVSQPTKSDKLEDSGVSQSVQGVSELTPDELPDYTTSDQPYQTYIKNQKGGIADRTKIEKHYPNLDITKLIREGDLYEPKPGFIGVLE